MSSMPKAMTVRERQLSDEVIRIRGLIRSNSDCY